MPAAFVWVADLISDPSGGAMLYVGVATAAYLWNLNEVAVVVVAEIFCAWVLVRTVAVFTATIFNGFAG